jgi:two-component system response regulator FixJ
MPAPALVHIIDDDDAVRDSLALLLGTADLEVQTYASAVTFLAAAPQHASGCILTDVRMPDMDGLTLLRRLGEAGIRLPVIVMTGHGDVPIAVEALKAGAVDFLEKPFDDERLIAAIRNALDISRAVLSQAAANADTIARMGSLTPRERQVLDLLVAGKPNKVIAFDLGASPRTVEVHRARVMEKMGVRSLAELVRIVIAVEPAPMGAPHGAS